MLTPSILQQTTTRFFSDLLDSPMSEDWLERNLGFACMASDYAMYPVHQQTQEDSSSICSSSICSSSICSSSICSKQLLDASSDPPLSCFPASFAIDDLCAKMEEEEYDEVEYEEDLEADEDLEEIAEAAVIQWSRQQNFPVDLRSANETTEFDRNPTIDKDPWSWTVDDVTAWCDWALRRFRVTDAQRDHLLNNLHRSGKELCQFSVSDFQEQFKTSGMYLYAELELWKNVHVIESAESDTTVDMDAADHPVSGRNSVALKVSTKIESSNNTNHSLPCLSTTPEYSGLTSDSASTSQPSSSQENFASSQDHRIPTFVVDSVPDTPSYENDASARGPLSEYAAAASGGGGKEERLWGCFDSSRLLNDADSGVSLDSDCMTTYDAAQKRSSGDSLDIWQPHAKQGNHLWQFLHELLSQTSLYVDCIRWLDRKQGIFKIEDSVQVARLWGERKNRPAMNYDKLSRSIRQYYKKGIIRKTSQSKRLVYQFCPSYA